MSLFPSTLTGRILDDGVTAPPVIELQGISAGQLATVLTAYTPLETTTQNTADIGTNAAAIAALQGQVAALPVVPDLTPYALAADLAAAEGLIAANASGLTAVNTSLTLGLASKANQSALDALQVQVDGKSTPASVDLKLANHPTTAAMNSSIASTNNATLATVAATYALKSVVDQLAIDVAARQTAADVDQRVATALLSYLTQTAYQAGQALQDTRLDGHDAEILALQNAGPFATAGDLSNLQLTLQSAIDGILAEIATLGGATNLVNAPAWLGNVTWDLLAGTNQIRNLHATGPLSIQLANDDWTLSFGCDAYSKAEADALLAPLASEVWVSNEILAALAAYSTTVQVGTAISDALGAYSSTAEMNTAISDAIDALNVGQYQDAGGVQFLIDQALLAYWTQAEVSSFVAGELANYATSSSVTSAISSALSSYDNSSQVDSKIITALLDIYTQTEVDQQITNALGNVDLSNYFTQAETQSYVANELLAYYPRSELDSQLTATFTQYWTSSRTQTEIDDAIAGAGFLTQALADARYFAVSANGSFESLVRTNVTPPQIKALLPRAPLAASTILTDTTLELTCDAYTKAEADGRYLSSSNFAPLDARYFPRNPAVAEGNGLFHLVQEQFTPKFIRSLLFRPPLTGGAILGNGSVIEIEADCWSKAQSDSRYPLVATFNSLGSTVTSIDGRVTALENAPGVAPTADLTVNSLTATSFVQTPLLQSAAADLQIRNATTTLRAEDGTLLASFAAGSIGLEQDITVRSDRTLNATTADFAQFFVGSTAATGAFTSSSSITATQQIESDLRVQAPLLRCDPAASVLTVTGGTQGVLVDDTLRVNGAIAPEASLPFLSLTGGSSGVQVLSPLLEQIAVVPNSSVGIVARNAAATGDATLILDSNAQNGLVELKALAGGGVQMNTLFQFMSFNTTNGLANLAIEPNIGGSNNGELIFGYGFVNLSDKALKTNVRDLSEKELQETFDAVEPRMYDRIEGGKDQIGFIAQEVQATPLGERVCKTKNLDGRALMTLDYQKLNVVLWGVVKSLQKRVEKLEKKKRGRS